MVRKQLCLITAAFLSFSLAPAAHAEEADAPTRTRVGLGLQLVPKFPGSEDVSLRPMIDVSRAKGTEEFDFEAPDESFGFAVLKSGNLVLGPAISLEGSRKADDVGASLPKVGFTVEVGAFAQYAISESFRLRSEVRRGIGGHGGWVGNIGADFVKRDGDKWLFSVGPRVTLSSRKYQQAYFGVSPSASLSSGLPAYQADGGLTAVGVASGYLRQISPRWGVSTYAKYDRLVGDAAKSPIVRQLGSRNQLHGGIGLTYTFGKAVAN
jgi:outer membrane scaffolding protein for murein synthesis (MipA/OmpV family)